MSEPNPNDLALDRAARQAIAEAGAAHHSNRNQAMAIMITAMLLEQPNQEFLLTKEKSDQIVSDGYELRAEPLKLVDGTRLYLQKAKVKGPRET